ncbi:hypothetical protein RHSIM_Rhsim01G0120900 [Rhododendron simsii]|uniref:Squalene cyclase N-terminal domain-containing protein n=1 Tax=Rhododendron simsii TaxID=118357 RepID=A0A834HQP8_RHOSS|nr:hypothetical protein RHSIM_Rhsim01G0120900 [Rhododendron simsii]
MQLLKENNFQQTIPAVKVGEDADVTYEVAAASVKRALRFSSAMQAKDGHWPAENAGPLFFLPPLVMCLYITGHLDEIFSPEHKKEILRYIYNHQVNYCHLTNGDDVGDGNLVLVVFAIDWQWC